MMTKTATMIITTAALALLIATATQAFAPPQVRARPFLLNGGISRAPSVNHNHECSLTVTSTTALSMYNLPPGGGGSGGGGGDNNGLKDALGGIGTIAAIALFFASPLGSIFFAVTNSLFLLAILLPVGAYVAFQAWQFFNTINGPCPNCGAPATVLKDTTTPSFCFNCGTVLQTSSDKTTIEFAKESTVVDDGFSTTESIFDALFSGQTQSPMGGGPPGSSSQSSASTTKEKESKYRRESTIIDVIDAEIEDE